MEYEEGSLWQDVSTLDENGFCDWHIKLPEKWEFMGRFKEIPFFKPVYRERPNPETQCSNGHELEEYEGSTFCDKCKMP